MSEETNHLLSVRNLRTSFRVSAGEVRSVDGISFDVDKGKILGIVGESGSGKSVTASSIMQILASTGRVKEGSSIIFEGEELVGMDDKELRKIRGNKIAMIFQDPMTALNPVFTIGHQMEEAMLIHRISRVDELVEPERRRLRDDKTALNRLLALRKEEKSSDQAQKEKSTADEKVLRSQIAQDEAELDVALIKAEAQAEYEKTLAQNQYRYEFRKLFHSLRTAMRGAVIERRQEASRYDNEKEAALRDEAKREKEKTALALAAIKRDHAAELAAALLPLKKEMAKPEISAETRSSLKRQIAETKAKHEKILQNDQSAIDAAFVESKAAYEQKLKDLKREHKARLKTMSSKRKATIREAFDSLKGSYETYRASFGVTRYSAKKKAIAMLKLVGVSEPEKRMKQYPFEFSGGMLQRVMIAMALLCEPDLLIADEPTTALDVTIQAQILELIKDIQKKLGMGVIIITHDLGVVAQVCDEVAVMYAGRIIERGSVDEIFYDPKHEYTKGLLASIPGEDAVKGRKLHPIEGNPIDVFALPKGCSFAPRCERCMKICLERFPAERPISPRHIASCFASALDDVKAKRLTEEDFIAYMNQGFIVRSEKGVAAAETPHDQLPGDRPISETKTSGKEAD